MPRKKPIIDETFNERALEAACFISVLLGKTYDSYSERDEKTKSSPFFCWSGVVFLYPVEMRIEVLTDGNEELLSFVKFYAIKGFCLSRDIRFADE